MAGFDDRYNILGSQPGEVPMLVDASGRNFITSPVKNSAQQIVVQTRRGTLVENEQKIPHPPQFLQAVAQEMLDNSRYEPPRELRSLSSVYNCVGMVFASRRTCIDAEHIATLLVEEGYSQLESSSVVQFGDLVIYKNAKGYSHVAMFVSRTVISADQPEDSSGIRVLSQWGAGCEFFHQAEDVPDALGTPVEYWTERNRDESFKRASS